MFPILSLISASWLAYKHSEHSSHIYFVHFFLLVSNPESDTYMVDASWIFAESVLSEYEKYREKAYLLPSAEAS